MRKLVRSAIAALAVAGLQAGLAHATDLGPDGLTFTVLSTGGKVIMNKDSQAGLGGDGAMLGMIGGRSANLKKNAQSVDYVVTTPQGITLSSGAEAFGCVTSGASIRLAGTAQCVNHLDTSGTDPALTSLANAIGDVTLFAGVVGAQLPTQTPGAINVPADANVTITNSQIGLNIISVPSLTTNKSTTLSFDGAPGDSTPSTIVRVDGNLKLGNNSTIHNDGCVSGLSNCLIFVVSGKLVAIGKDAQISGTILAPNATCKVGVNTQLVGPLICGKTITLGSDSQVLYVPTTVTIP